MIKILVVEDEEKLNRSVCRFLQDNGYEPVSCLDADEALDVMSEQIINMIISDIMMPGMDGFEFADAVLFTRIRIGRKYFANVGKTLKKYEIKFCIFKVDINRWI